nr:stalk domain-containing protein [uncultured Dysosmobacter sp.]
MKRLASLALSLMMLLTLTVPIAHAAEASPTPPSWVKETEYVLFDGDPVYQAEKWQQIQAFRADAAAGHPEPQSGEALASQWSVWTEPGASGMRSRKDFSVGEWFERGLAAMQYAANSDTGRKASTADTCFTQACSAMKTAGADITDPDYQTVLIWRIRAALLRWAPTGSEKPYTSYLSAVNSFIELRRIRSIKLAEVLDSPVMDALSETARNRITKDINEISARVNISIDGTQLRVDYVIADGREASRDVDPVIVNGRTMVPIRMIAEALGADVEWVSSFQGARLTRAGVQIDLPIGKTTGYKNGEPFQMEVAPYVKDGRTMVPARYVAEFFGQHVEFNSETRTVEITEEETAVGGSNLGDWILPMGAMLNKLNGQRNPTILGGCSRAGWSQQNAKDYARGILNGDSWNIQSREDLIETVCRMTFYGHNVSFLYDVALINSMSAAEYQQLLKNAQGMDAYMFPYTKQLGAKWGDRGILCWDLFRMSNLVQWGYLAGYLTYPEALALLEPAATLLHDNFKSWDEAYENYLDGYNWWARNNVLNKDVWTTTRGTIYQSMKADESVAPIFDNSLFKTAVKGVPGVTAEQLLSSIQ